jgi:hypothetical protein
MKTAFNAYARGRQILFLVWGCLVLSATLSCARSQTARLVKASLRDRCETARRAAKFTFIFDPRFTCESIPDGICAQTLATVAGKRLLRVTMDLENPPREVSLFKEGESCDWPDLQLVGQTFAGMDKSITDAVELVFWAEEPGGIPFRVGVVSRSLEEERLPPISPCGVMPGIMKWSKGDWQFEADLRQDP